MGALKNQAQGTARSLDHLLGGKRPPPLGRRNPVHGISQGDGTLIELHKRLPRVANQRQQQFGVQVGRPGCHGVRCCDQSRFGTGPGRRAAPFTKRDDCTAGVRGTSPLFSIYRPHRCPGDSKPASEVARLHLSPPGCVQCSTLPRLGHFKPPLSFWSAAPSPSSAAPSYWQSPSSQRLPWYQLSFLSGWVGRAGMRGHTAGSWGLPGSGDAL